eukprot:TRINITY_DN2489_c6_g1_i1.p1 TRINITY_DN2489_c6_g1~~TRINITY_DN2489_c6_g1_i1.p1  ORF type:complete len:207 (-),score=41.36 TRINITY_DN2489_c6_g1_i1:76-696(-)
MANNIPRVSLDEIVVPRKWLIECLRCLVHTVVFHRAFGTVKPREVLVEPLDLVYARVDSPGMESRIERQLADFEGKVLGDPSIQVAQVIMSWVEERETRNLFGMASKEAIRWEQWIFSFRLKDEGVSSESVHTDLQKALIYILRTVNDHKSHIPPVQSKEVMPFPFTMEWKFPGKSTESMFGLGKMLSAFRTGGGPVLSDNTLLEG